jgi:hypothetical protein
MSALGCGCSIKDAIGLDILGSCGHQVIVEGSASANILKLWLPLAKVILGIIKDLPCLVGTLETRSNVTRDDWGVIEEVQETTAMAG